MNDLNREHTILIM